jgi:dTDP-4-amino-4,6-dideoxygalactose transaminase
MNAENIESRPTWKPMHLQPVFSGCRVRGGAVAEQIFEQGLCLPSGSNLTEEDRLRVADIVCTVGGCTPATLDARAALLPKRRAA